MTGNTLLVQLNEINFHYLKKNYLANGRFPALEALVDGSSEFYTSSEDEYETLEPWIQWVSVYSGKPFSEHKVFHLGDSAKCETNNWLCESLERLGASIGCVAPMNMPNNLRNPLFFIPDPWIQTPVSGDHFAHRVYDMLCQVVNDNSAGKISFRSAITIFEVIVRTFDTKFAYLTLKNVWMARQRPWMKALVLDTLICSLHLYYIQKFQPNFSTVFLNAGAHIQHHHFKTSIDNLGVEGQDPILDVCTVYDRILERYLNLVSSGVKLITATGLSQNPFNDEIYYYRLKNHEDFLRTIGINFSAVNPRMTRDFEIIFTNAQNCVSGMNLLKSIYVLGSNTPLFDFFDRKNNSLFLSLTYGEKISPKTQIVLPDGRHILLQPFVNFVAQKQGHHDPTGYCYFSKNCGEDGMDATIFVGELYDKIIKICMR